MLVDCSATQPVTPVEELTHNGFSVVGTYGPQDDWVADLQRVSPDIVMIDTPKIDDGLLGRVKAVHAQAPVPIALFSNDDHTEKIFAAVEAGVNAFFTGSLETNKLRPAADVAFAQFSAHTALRDTIEKANTALAERKVIERAKGIVMKTRALEEAEAYKQMRQVAMSRNLRLIKLAETIIDAEELLKH